MTNDEIRNNDQALTGARVWPNEAISSLVIRASFVLRHSSFVILPSLLFLLLAARAAAATDYPAPVPGDYVIHDFHFRSGEALPELRVHYLTLGAPQRDAQGVVRNAVLIMHGTTGNGSNFIRREFAGELFGKGQLLDATRYYLVLPDGIGHGHSSKPSDGLRAHFPHYGYRDMIEAQHRLLTEGLNVNHLRLVMGTSMGGMHTWLWGETYPEFMDALMPLASLPDADLRPQPRLAPDDHRRHPHRSRLAEWRVPNPAARFGRRGRGPVLHGKQPGSAAERSADPRASRSLAGHERRQHFEDSRRQQRSLRPRSLE